MPRPPYLDPVEAPISGRSCLYLAILAVLLVVAGLTAVLWV